MKSRDLSRCQKTHNNFLYTQFSWADLTVAVDRITDGKSFSITLYLVHEKCALPDESKFLITSLGKYYNVIFGSDANVRYTS